MTTVESTFPLLGPDGVVTYTTYGDLPSDVYMWDYWANDPSRSHFRFELVPSGEHFRIYVLEQPPYNGRDEGLIVTHRHQDDSGRYYVCVGSCNEPQTVAEAMTWYAYWAERTVEYIATGKAFS